MNLEEGQAVMCTVTQIAGTTVFVKIEGNGEGTVVTSEVAPGRIRNLRDYIIPNKKIICKILRIDNNNIHLSLRRVSLKEKKEVLESWQKEQNALSILKTVLDEKFSEVAERIRKEAALPEFLQNCKTDAKKLQQYMTPEQAERICKILSEKKEKEVVVKRKFFLKSEAGDGITRVKKILPPEATYLGAGKFLLEIKNKDYKEANTRISRILKEVETNAKEKGCAFEAEK